MVLRKDLIGYDQLYRIAEEYPQSYESVKTIWAALKPEDRSETIIREILEKSLTGVISPQDVINDRYAGEVNWDKTKSDLLNLDLGAKRRSRKRFFKWLSWISLIIVETNCFMILVMIYNVPVLPGIVIMGLSVFFGAVHGYLKALK